MKKCLAPCYGGCSGQRYSEEASAVHAFLRTRGASLLAALAAERDRASEALDFEAAAAVHARYSKAEAVAALAPELAGALAAQHGILVQPAVEPDTVDLYLLDGGVFTGPASFSILGMRLPNEQSGSSSLFAHPAAIAPVPLGPAAATGQTPDQRLAEALAALAAARNPGSKQEICDQQSLLARWYFRPQGKREGELIFSESGNGSSGESSGESSHEPVRRQLPLKALLRACARVYRSHLEKHAPQPSDFGTAQTT